MVCTMDIIESCCTSGVQSMLDVPELYTRLKCYLRRVVCIRVQKMRTRVVFGAIMSSGSTFGVSVGSRRHRFLKTNSKTGSCPQLGVVGRSEAGDLLHS